MQADAADATASRSRTVGTGHRLGDDRAPTTAEVIHRTDATVARPMYAGVGVALHHFTDLLVAEVDGVTLHRATTVLTKQVCELVETDDVLERVQQLVTDPNRPALPDGTTAERLCGPSWPNVLAAAAERSEASLLGGQEFGARAILNLAVVRGVGAEHPWWGTPMWRDRVAALPDGAVTEEGRAILLDSPELVDDALLRLALELGDGAAPHRRVASYPAPPATSAAPQDGVTPSGETTRRQDASLY